MCALQLAGDFVRVRTRCWLVEGERSSGQNLRALSLACVDDDSQGEIADIIWDAELERGLRLALRRDVPIREGQLLLYRPDTWHAQKRATLDEKLDDA